MYKRQVLFCEARIQREGLILSYTEPEEMIPVYADPGKGLPMSLDGTFLHCVVSEMLSAGLVGGRIDKIYQQMCIRDRFLCA